MADNPDVRQPNDPNHNYHGGYQGLKHLPYSLERRIAFEADKMACAAGASRRANVAREEGRSGATSITANAVALANIEQSLAKREAVAGQPRAEADEIEEWKMGDDAARLRADLHAARRHSPEVEGDIETGGMRERNISKEKDIADDMFAPQRDNDKEELGEDAALSAQHAKFTKVKEEEEERKTLRKSQQDVTRDIFGLDGLDDTDGRRRNPFRIPLPPSRTVSMVTQVGSDSSLATAAATTSAWGTGLSADFIHAEATCETRGPSERVLDEGHFSSKLERELLKVIRGRQTTVGSLLAASRAAANLNGEDAVFQKAVSTTIGPHNQRRDKREKTDRCEELLRHGRSIAQIGGYAKSALDANPAHGAMEKEAREMAQVMIEEYEDETKALAEILIELSTAVHPQDPENADVRPHDPMDGSTLKEEAKRTTLKSDVTYKQNPREPEKRFEKDTTPEFMGRLPVDMARSGCILKELNHSDSAIRSRFPLDALPFEGQDIDFRRACLSVEKIKTEQEEAKFPQQHFLNTRVPAEQAASQERLSSAVLDPSLIYQRYLPQSAADQVTTSGSGCVGTTLPLASRSSAYWPRPDSSTAFVPASELGVHPTQPLDGSSTSYLPRSALGNISSTLGEVGPGLPLNSPSPGQPPTSARDLKDILNGVQRGEMDAFQLYDADRMDDNHPPRYGFSRESPYVFPGVDRPFSSRLSSVIPAIPGQQDSVRAEAERFSLEREVLASVAALAATGIDEAQEGHDAQSERSPVADRPVYQAAIDGAKTTAQGLTEDFAKEMRERTMREREERILKRARQISGQNSYFHASRIRSGGSRVASRGGDANDTACSGASRLEPLHPLELIPPGRQRLAGLCENEHEAGIRMDTQPDVVGPSAPLQTVRIASDGPPVPAFDGYRSAQFRGGRAVAAGIQNQPYDAMVIAAFEPKCTTFRPIYLHSARCDGCSQDNKSVLYRCNTCGGQWDRGCMEREEIHNGHGLDWTSLIADNEKPLLTGRSSAELKRGNDAGETLAKGATAVFEGSVHEAGDLHNNGPSDLTGRKVAITLSRKPSAKASAAEAPRPHPTNIASVSSAWNVEGGARVSPAAGRGKDGEKNKVDSSTEREFGNKIQLAREEAFKEYLAVAANQERRDEIFRRRQPHDETILALKRFREELAEGSKLKRREAGEGAEEGEDGANPAGNRVSAKICEMEGFLDDMWGCASHPTFIPAWQRSQAQIMDEAKRDDDEDEDEEQDLPGMTDQEMVKKIGMLKRIQKEFDRKPLRADEAQDEEEGEDSREAIEARKRFFEDYSVAKADAAESHERQPKCISAWQRALGRPQTDGAPRPPSPVDSTLAELAKAEASVSGVARSNTGASFRQGYKKDDLSSLADGMKQAKLSAAGLNAKVLASRRLRALDSISSSSESNDPLIRFPAMFLLSLDADMVSLASSFEQDPAVQDLTGSQFFEFLESTLPELWERWKEYCSDPLVVGDRSSEVREKNVGKEQTLRQGVEERGERFMDGMRKAVGSSVQVSGASNGKGKKKPNLFITTSRTITDLELQIERAKAFNEGNMAAFKDIETARKKGFEEGVKSATGQQSSSLAGLSGGGGNSSSAEGLKGPTKKTSTMSSIDIQTTNAPLTVNRKPARDKTDEHRERQFSRDSYWFWVPVQFDSSTSDFPQNFPWRSDGLTCELFAVMSPTTLPSLLSSLEAKVEEELEAMKVSDGNPAAAAAGVAGLTWLADHKFSGLTVLWNWRRENSPINVGAAAIPFVSAPSLRTEVTERNVDGALWMMSKDSGHLLLVHAAERVEGAHSAEKNRRAEE